MNDNADPNHEPGLSECGCRTCDPQRYAAPSPAAEGLQAPRPVVRVLAPGAVPDPGAELDARLAARLAALSAPAGDTEAAARAERDDECCGSTWRNDRTTWHCTRDPGHDPKHEAAVGGHLLATWDETGGIEFPQCAEAPAGCGRAYGAIPLSDLEVMNDGRPVTWSDACAPGGYVCKVPDPARPDGLCGNPVESGPCGRHGATDGQLAYEASISIIRADFDGPPWAWADLPPRHRAAFNAAAGAVAAPLREEIASLREQLRVMDEQVRYLEARDDA